MITLSDFEKQHIYMPARDKDAHKGDFGHIHMIGGSIGMSGAICLSGLAALRTGCGLVTALLPESINNIFEIKNTECMSVPLKDTNGIISTAAYDVIFNRVAKTDCIAFGMGIGRNKDITTILKNLLNDFEGKILIDADGLFALSDCLSELKSSKAEVVLTPHAMEFSRISGHSVNEIDKNRQSLAEMFAVEYDVTLVLKGKNTVVTDGKRTYINNTGNCGMATAGSGDVLSGIISSLIGQGVNVFDAACTGVFLHGLSGDIASKNSNEYYMISSDIIKYLDKAITFLLEGSNLKCII